VQILIETTRNKRRFKFTFNRVYQGVFGLQRILERVGVDLATHQSDDRDDMPRVHRIAMDALDFGAASLERLLQRNVPADQLQHINEDPEIAEEDYQALLEEVRGDADLRHAWEHASAAFGMARNCESKASTLGSIAAGLASAYALLGEDINGEELRGLYEESEPLVTLLLNLHKRFEDEPDVRLSSPGGTA
jgi:hypothetical protein